jgi:hypothetical protein
MSVSVMLANGGVEDFEDQLHGATASTVYFFELVENGQLRVMAQESPPEPGSVRVPPAQRVEAVYSASGWWKVSGSQRLSPGDEEPFEPHPMRSL